MLIALLVIFGGSLLSPLIFRLFKEKTGYFIGIGFIPIFIYFISLYTKIVEGEALSIDTLEIFPGIPFNLYLDGLSLVFALIVLGIGILVLFYSSAYMKHKPHQGRYYSYLLLFMASMLGLVISGNLIVLYIFWSLTGISSFLLIGFYNNDKESREAAFQALIVTESGGLAMLAGIVLLGIGRNTFDFPELLTRGEFFRDHALYVPVTLLIMLGAFTKSAQFPFHFWLPSAMKAPTPVSAFLHSATMVNAGIYLLARLNPVLGNTLIWKDVLMAVGLFTFFAGVYLSLTGKDLKIILAYTTVSSLGLLVFLIGTGTSTAIKAALLYLVAHALYKGSLFMVTGAIDETTGTRNINELSNLKKKMPYTSLIALIALLSMAGLPPLLGYVGKEFFYEATLHARGIGSFMISAGILSNAMMFFISAIIAWKVFLSGDSSGLEAADVKIKKSRTIAGFLISPAILSIFGFLLAFTPGKFEDLLEFSIEAVKTVPVNVNIEVWKGFSKVFYLSLLTIGTGISFFVLRNKILPAIEFINRRIFHPDFSRSFKKLGKTISGINTRLTEFIQPSHQGIYLLIIIMSTSFLLWFLILRSGNILGPQVTKINFPALGIILIASTTAIATVLIRTKLTAIVTMGVTGYGVAMIYMFYGAIDLAITQILVETFLLIIFVLAGYRLPQFKKFSRKITRLRDGIIALFAGSAISGLLILTTTRNKLSNQVAEEIISRSFTEAHGRNIVNVILVDFRALDTLGEIMVVSLAAVAIMLMLKQKTENKHL